VVGIAGPGTLAGLVVDNPVEHRLAGRGEPDLGSSPVEQGERTDLE
jgi:hypothetical protein